MTHHGNPDQLTPKRTHGSTNCFELAGGNEDNYLWARVTTDEEGNPVVCSTFVPTDEQRKRIAEGSNIELVVWGGQPPVAIHLDDTPIGKPPARDTE